MDFDQTLSIEDSGLLLSQKIGISEKDFWHKVEQLRQKNIVKIGAELPYLIIHDSDYKGKVSRELQQEIGRQVKLKEHVPDFINLLNKGVEGRSFSPYVVSAAPQEILKEALKKILPLEHLYGTTFTYNKEGKIMDVKKAGAGTAKVDALNIIRNRERVSPEKIIYVGDGLSDMHIMLHLKAYNGYSIAVSPSPYLGHIARRTVISTDVMSVLIPILEEIIGLSEDKIKSFFADIGYPLSEWNRAKVEWVDLAKN